MPYKFMIPLLAVVTTAFVVAPGVSALAQFNLPGVGGSNTTSDRMGGGVGKSKAGSSAAKTTTSTKSNTVDRMGGGGGGKGATKGGPTDPAESKNLNTSRSNIYWERTATSAGSAGKNEVMGLSAEAASVGGLFRFIHHAFAETVPPAPS
jgi:hypothetical protein